MPSVRMCARCVKPSTTLNGDMSIFGSGGCELCEAARMSEWFYEDDECWIAECESCAVPMVVWREHNANPSDEVKTRLHEKLEKVVEEFFDFEMRIDNNMRTIPDHYHAHARPKGGFYGYGLRRAK
ncbi:unannotated protein [freshwater metagenome]|uniref:Unannotated protein n=1 Tax=freshwater metagenome TaxID=449393 RepID=A0A6J6IUV0_9ZZZZ